MPSEENSVILEERQENRSRAMQELGDMFDREVAETDGGRDFDLANPDVYKRQMRGNSHVRFLGGKGAVMSLTYPTSSRNATSRNLSLIHI